MTTGRTVLVAQSGGPTPVVNASLAGVIREARGHPEVGTVIGALNGVLGMLQGRLVSLDGLSDTDLDALARTPSAALGSCRYQLTDDEAAQVVKVCRDLGVGYLLYIGGNDSADTSHRIAMAAEATGSELRVIGIPKTIDNDLPVTDHSPGYGSVARFVAWATRDAGLDTRAMRHTDPVRFIEVMGRYAGWVAAASALGKTSPDAPPHLVYVPERPVWPEQVVSDVLEVYREYGYCVVVMSENQRDPTGRVIGADDRPAFVDAFGHAYYDSPAQYLSRMVTRETGIRARCDRPGAIQRSLSACVSMADWEEALLVGRMAVRYAVSGHTDCMVVLLRQSGPEHRCSTALAPLEEIANRQKLLPDEYIASAGNQITQAFREYALPLIGGPLPPYHRPW